MAAYEFSQQGQIDEDALSSFSFPSQPPDIRNWFSSYAYESPDIWGNVDSHEDESEEITMGKDGEEDPIPSEEEQLVEDQESTQKRFLSESDSFIPHEKGVLRLEEGLIWSNNSLSTANNAGEPAGSGAIRSSKLTLSLNNEELPKQISLQEHDENDIEVEENGFVSTRKRIDLCRNEEMSECQFIAVIGKRGGILEEEEEEDEEKAALVNGKQQSPVRRKPFAEQTNVIFDEEETATADPGKWRCPRKSKSYSGPPLKQLRLEHWVKISKFGS